MKYDKDAPIPFYQHRIAELEAENKNILSNYAVLEATLAEHEQRWAWLNGSILAISKEGYSEWASVVLAVINKCRYEPLEKNDEHQ